MKKSKKIDYEIELNTARQNLKIPSSLKVNLKYQLMIDLKDEMKALLNDGVSITEIFKRLKLNMSLNTFLGYAEKIGIIAERQKRERVVNKIAKPSESIPESNVNESVKTEDKFTEKEIWEQVRNEYLEIHKVELNYQKGDREMVSEVLQILEMLPDEYRICKGFEKLKNKAIGHLKEI